jgi:hypothetical protein
MSRHICVLSALRVDAPGANHVGAHRAGWPSFVLTKHDVVYIRTVENALIRARHELRRHATIEDWMVQR